MLVFSSVFNKTEPRSKASDCVSGHAVRSFQIHSIRIFIRVIYKGASHAGVSHPPCSARMTCSFPSVYVQILS